MGSRLADTVAGIDVLIDARLALRGLGIATFIERLTAGFDAVPSVRVTLWKASAPWSVKGQLATLARSGLFDVSPRLDPRTRRFAVTHYACNLGSLRPGPHSVVTVHDLMYRRNLRSRDRFTGYLLERCLRRAGRVVAVSEQTRADIDDAFPDLRGRVDVIPHGMRRLPRPTGERRHVLAFGGGSDPRKRVDLMIGAYREYRATAIEPLPLVVLSRAGLTETQAHELAHLGATVVPDAPAATVDRLTAGAAALLYPTAEEGFGLPILEAAEVGTRVVLDAGARVAGEVLGPHCISVSDPAPSAWASAVCRAIDEGPVFDSLSLPDWGAVASRYARLYLEVGG